MRPDQTLSERSWLRALLQWDCCPPGQCDLELPECAVADVSQGLLMLGTIGERYALVHLAV